MRLGLIERHAHDVAAIRTAGVAGLSEVFTPEAAIALNQAGDDLPDRLNGSGPPSTMPLASASSTAARMIGLE